jgi:hypothetical protein
MAVMAAKVHHLHCQDHQSHMPVEVEEDVECQQRKALEDQEGVEMRRRRQHQQLVNQEVQILAVAAVAAFKIQDLVLLVLMEVLEAKAL